MHGVRVMPSGVSIRGILGPVSDERCDLTPEQAATACTALAEILVALGGQKKEPAALYGLLGLIGATLLRFADYSTGQLVDLMHEYADDEPLVQAIADVLRREGMLPSEPLPSEKLTQAEPGSDKPN